ncbi:polymer-forming cytoskeletal protein [Kiritimatiellaeota bacterium B1221]|nr:polymer-forming cytoskeletal protein [Kiritimatiellaeota bacterium B1221]
MKKFILLLICLTGILPAHPPGTETWSLFEETIDFDGAATDDFFAVANEIKLQGEFQDDIWAAGRKIEFSGRSADDVRLLALEVLTVNGEIDGNLRGYASVGNILLNTNTVIDGHAILQAGKRITVKGTIKGDLWVDAPNVVIEADIQGNLTLRGNEIQLLDGTVIHGDLFNRNQQTLALPSGVEVKGERKQISDEAGQLEKDIQTWKWMLLAIQFFTSFVVGILLLRLLPRFTGHNVDLLLHHRTPSLTLGLLTFLPLTLTAYFLLPTLIGTGLGIFLLVVTGLLFYLGKIMVAYAIGLIILRKKTDLTFGKLVQGLFLGLVVLYSAYSLVYIGDVLYFMTSCWGMGTLITSIRHSQRVLKIEIPSLSQPPSE